MAITKVCGIETEYGILSPGPEQNPIAASSVLVNAYAADVEQQIGWDFEDETPGNDAVVSDDTAAAETTDAPESNNREGDSAGNQDEGLNGVGVYNCGQTAGDRVNTSGDDKHYGGLPQ